MFNHIDNEHIASIVTEPSGRIIKIKNPFKVPFLSGINSGINIEDALPLFYGYFPMTEKHFIFESISFDGFSGNIICENNNTEVAIYFYDQTKHANSWAKVLQKHNQDKLINKLVMKTSNSNLSTSVLDALGFMSFEKKESGFVIIGDIPNWFRGLFPHHNYSSSIFELDDLFPFLEVFLPEVDQLFGNTSNGKLISGVWAAYNSLNEEVILQASAVKENGSTLFFIESLSERFPNQHKNIQQARETNLEHQQLIKVEMKLRELFENQEQFISMFSHDIRGPLSGANSLLQILKKDQAFMKNFTPDQAELFNIMHKGLGDLYDYAFRLHDWSKVHFGNINLDFSSVDLFQMVSNVRSLNLKTLQDKGLQLVIDVPEGVSVKVDESFFKNALHNLLSNAIKFSHPGDEIKFSAVIEDSQVSLKISDQGIGMSDEVKNNIFENGNKKSVRGTKGEKGTGIGLSVVKRIVDLHNASISVESELGKGTQFTIQLPKPVKR